MKNEKGYILVEEMFNIDSDFVYESDITQKSFDIVGVFVIAVDPKGIITMINKKALDDLGYLKKELIGESFIKLLVAENKQKQTALQLEKIFDHFEIGDSDCHYYLKTHNKERIILDARNVRILDKNDHIKGIIISGKDISGILRDRKNLKKDVDLYRVLVNNLPEINLYLLDENLEFILAEGTEMKNINLSHNDFEGNKLKDVPKPKLVKIWKPLFQEAVHGYKVNKEYQLENYHYILSISPVRNSTNESISFVAITRNITDEKRTAENLKKSKEEAERSNQAKNLFLARVSHEIRTPLNAILGFTEQLKQTSLGRKQEKYVDIIDESSEHLLSLINDILVLSKIEAQQIRFEENPFRLSYVIDYIRRSLKNKAAEKGLKFRVVIEPEINRVLIGDAFRLQQILLNLLNNAIKFTSSGFVELRCYVEDETKNKITAGFSVSDSGIGISEENLENIFKSFNQAKPETSRLFGGTGLGLNICKNLIRLQYGTLSVSSEEGKGSTFTFTLPYRKGEEMDLHHSSDAKIHPELLSHINCLLVDDDNVNRLLGKTILEKLNCSFDIAKNGKEALEYIENHKYDVILLDIHMPDVSGIDVANYLRKEKNDKDTRIIALTAAALKKDILKYYETGMNEFLIKPFKEIHLYNKICEVLNIKGHTKEKTNSEIILKNELNPRPYDLHDLKKMSNYSKIFISNMLNTFIENSRNAINDFERFRNEEKWEQIGEVAHKILPSYRHLAVESVIPKLIELKTRTIETHNYDEIPEITRDLILEMKKVISELEDELGE